MKNLVMVGLGLLILLSGCSGRKKSGNSDTPTSGSIKIAVDEALKPLIEAEIFVFTSLYTNAHIEAIYCSEEEAIDLLLKDSVRMAIATRKLVASEEDVLSKVQIKAHQVNIALDGAALIVHPENPDTVMMIDQLKGVLTGEIKKWNQLNKTSKANTINVVFDQPNSGIIRYLNDSIVPLKTLPENCFAVKNNAAVIDYVKQHPEALGLIDVSWISDEDDSTTNVFLKSIKVVGLSKDKDGGEYFKPYPAYMSLHEYPLLRNVQMISREVTTGLASGFIAFVASDKGQRIVLKSGLVPATMPLRIVEVNRAPFK
jgi:phosphate transport system substrate-binding protein